MKPLVLAALVVLAFGVFAWSLSRLVRFVLAGRPDGTRFDQFWRRLGDVILYFLLQGRVAREKQSWHHLIIFWGFLIICVGTLFMLLSGLFGVSIAGIFGTTLGNAIATVIDVFNLLVLLCILFAFFRRIVLRPPLIPLNFDAGLILTLIGLLMVTHFLTHGFETAAGVAATETYPISEALGRALSGMNPESAHTAFEINWWIHIGIVLFFLNYLPYSKHSHLLGSLPNIYFRNLGQQMVMPKLNLEDENDWGVGKYNQLTWKALLDPIACTHCARCSNNCPAWTTEKPLSPMNVILDLGHDLRAHGSLTLRRKRLEARMAALGSGRPAGALPEHAGNRHGDHAHSGDAHEADAQGAGAQATDGAGAASGGNGKGSGLELMLQPKIDALITADAELPPLIRPGSPEGKFGPARHDTHDGYWITEDALWACTTCGACEQNCPVFIEHPQKIVQMRSNLVLAESKVPGEVARMYTGLERNSNPWGVGADKRMDWADGLNVPTLAESAEAQYMLFVGCAAAVDDRIKKQMQALVKVLRAANVNFAVLGLEEGCCGDPARRTGNEMLFQMEAEANITAMNGYGVKKVIVACPHCLHVLRNEYPQFGGNYQVIHHSQLLLELVQSGRLKLGGEIGKRVVYHDPCYLGRWNKMYEVPRKLLASVPGVGEVVEPRRCREKSFCCGGGGGHMWMEEKAPRVNSNRTAELLATGADQVAVACPFCTIMIEDGLKEANQEDRVKVLELSEVLARSLPAPN